MIYEATWKRTDSPLFATMLMTAHLRSIIGLDQARAQETTRNAPAGIGLHLCDHRGIAPGNGVQDHARSLPHLDDEPRPTRPCRYNSARGKDTIFSQNLRPG